MIKTALAVVITCLAVSSQIDGQSQNDVDEALRQADLRRQEYVETFKDLTAVETRFTEVFDGKGRVARQRVVVSDFLVYRSKLGDEGVAEFRIAREVDGRAVGNPTEDAIKLFQRLASARTLAQESDRLRAANLKYGLRYVMWGGTLEPMGVARRDRRRDFDFAIAGRERIGDHDTVVLRYEPKQLGAVESRGIFRHFTKPRMGFRGRVWLDAQDWRLRRVESNMVVADEKASTPVTVFQTTIEYEPSAFGILTPKTIVGSFFDKATGKKDVPSMRLVGRITATYASFKRFQVSTDTEIALPKEETR